ncbi:hypothetical protein [Planctomicrobium sp. SH664]|uniref:hypothetical protein n=1 Tax=Planctomicrobium sp. SH664 TaxID=3448125 RepID=UPI003F5BFF07
MQWKNFGTDHSIHGQMARLDGIALQARGRSKCLLRTEGAGNLIQCYDSLAMACELIVWIWASPGWCESDLKRACQFLAEAQSSVRACATPSNAFDDLQLSTFDILRAICVARRFHLSRYMKLADLADPGRAKLLQREIIDFRRDLWMRSERSTRPRSDSVRNRVPHVAKSSLAAFVESVLTVVEARVERHKERVRYAESAMASAVDHPRGDADGVALALDAIHEVLWGLYFEAPAGSQNIETAFRQLTGQRLSLRERRLTRRDAGMMRERRVVSEGRKYLMEPHIKVGRKSTAVRIHYAADHERRLLIVGWCGQHLTTSGTRLCR